MHPAISTYGRGILGIFVMVAVAFLLSNNKKKINWRLVVTGLLLQFLIAVAVLKVGFIRHGFEFVSAFFVALMDFTREGSVFLFLDVARRLDERGLPGFLADCFEDGVLLAPGGSSGRDYEQWVRLCYTAAPPEQVAEAVRCVERRLR